MLGIDGKVISCKIFYRVVYNILSKVVQGNIFSFLAWPRPHGIDILVFQKTHSIFKLIFRASELQQRPKVDIFEEAQFSISASSTNLVLKVVPIEAG